jgi:hypothetical protein
MDVGSIRHWPRMTHDQLVKVFPNGRTVHVPSDGKPLAGYALALADVEKKGHVPSSVSLASARNAGAIDEADEDAADRIASSPRRSVTPALTQLASADPSTRSPGIQPPLAEPAPPAKINTIAIIPMPKHRPAKQIAVASLVPTPTPRPGLPVEIASADPVVTATTGTALAYAAEAEPPVASRAAPMGTSTVPLTPAEGQMPLAKSAQLAFAHPAARFDNPWMRATIMAPNVRQFLTTTPTGRLDTRQVREFMQKPRTPVVMMSFSDDPQNGLRTDTFSGQAVVFLATLPSTTRTAALTR